MGKRIFALCGLLLLALFWLPTTPAHASAKAGYITGDCIEGVDIPSDRAYECGVMTVPL